MKMETHAEHEQNDPELGELFGDVRVGDETRCERPDQHAGEEVADDR